jgi:hypothetical protein
VISILPESLLLYLPLFPIVLLSNLVPVFISWFCLSVTQTTGPGARLGGRCRILRCSDCKHERKRERYASAYFT